MLNRISKPDCDWYCYENNKGEWSELRDRQFEAHLESLAMFKDMEGYWYGYPRKAVKWMRS